VRPVSQNENDVILSIASRLDEDLSRRLNDDLIKAMAHDALEDGSRILFEIDGYIRPPYRGQHPFPVEGTMKDSDGADLQVILYADEQGHLLELEIIRWMGGPLRSPNWNSFRITG
jgi:hypothetical protein